MRFRLAVLLMILVSAWALTASALSGGPPADTVKNDDGCSCHGPRNQLTEIHDLTGWPATYVPGQDYLLSLSSTNDVQPKPGLEKNQGGFLAWVSHGDLFQTPGGDQPAGWIAPGTMSSGEAWVRHTKQGETENGKQVWNFTWTAPSAGSGTATIHVYVNRINSDNSNSGDHWNRRTFTSSEGSGTPTSVFPTPSHTNTEPVDTTETSQTTTDDTGPGTTTNAQPGLGIVLATGAVVAVALLRRRLK